MHLIHPGRGHTDGDLVVQFVEDRAVHRLTSSLQPFGRPRAGLFGLEEWDHVRGERWISS